MNDRKNADRKSGFFSPFLLAVAVLAICATGAAILLAPAEATSGISRAGASRAATYAVPTGYFPDQFVNQAKEIEPMPEIYY